MGNKQSDDQRNKFDIDEIKSHNEKTTLLIREFQSRFKYKNIFYKQYKSSENKRKLKKIENERIGLFWL